MAKDIQRGVKFRITTEGVKQIQDINQDFRDVGDSADKAEKKSQSFFKTLTQAAVGASLFAGVKSFFSDSIKELNKFDNALLKLNASARQNNASFDDAKRRIQELAQDGQIGIQDLSDQFSQLLRLTGGNVDLAGNFIKAAKAVSTFKGVTSDTTDNINKFISGLTTGSVEVLENLNPALQGTIKELGGGAEIATNAEKRFKLLNKVIEDGNDLWKDYETFTSSAAAQQVKLQKSIEAVRVEVGEQLRPILLDIIGPLIDFIQTGLSTFKNLSDGTKRFILIVGALGAALLGIIPIAIAFWTAITGPIGIAVAAITALTAGITALAISFGETQAEQFAREMSEINEQLEMAEEGTAAYNEALAKQNKLLEKLPKNLRNAAKEIARTTGDIVKQRAALAALQQVASGNVALDEQKRQLAQLEDQLATRRRELQETGRTTPVFGGSSDVGRTIRIQGARGLFTDPKQIDAALESNEATRELIGTIKGLRKAVEAQTKNERKPPPTPRFSGGGRGGNIPNLTDFLLGELRKSLKAVVDAQKEFEKGVNARLKGEARILALAEARRVSAERQNALIEQAQADLSGALDSTFTAQLLAIRLETDALLNVVDELEKIGEIDLTEAAERRAEIEERAARRFAETVRDSAQALADSSNALIDAIRSGDGFGAIGAAGGLGSTLGDTFGSQILGTFGAALSGFGAIGGLLTNLFGGENAEEERRRKEEERARRREEAFKEELRLIKEKIKVEQAILSLKRKELDAANLRQEAELQLLNLADTTLSSQLTTQIETLSNQLSEDLRNLAGTSNVGPLGLVGGDIGNENTQQAVLDTLENARETQSNLETVSTLLGQLTEDNLSAVGEVRQAFSGTGTFGITDSTGAIDALRDIVENEQGLLGGAFGGIQSVLDRIDANLPDLSNGPIVGGPTGFLDLQDSQETREQERKFRELIEDAIREVQAAATGLEGSISGDAGILSQLDNFIADQQDILQQQLEIEELRRQLAVQQFQDELALIERLEKQSDLADGVFDSVARLQGVADSILRELGVGSVGEIDIESLTQTQVQQFDLLTGVLQQIENNTKETAANTRRVTERVPTLIDFARSGILDQGTFAQFGLENATPNFEQFSGVSVGSQVLTEMESLARLVEQGDAQIALLSAIESNTKGGNLAGAGSQNSRRQVRNNLNQNRVRNPGRDAREAAIGIQRR